MSLRNTNKVDLYHPKGCNCFDCQDDYIQTLQARYFKPNFIDATGRSNHADAIAKPPSYFLDSILVAKQPVTIYKTPDKNGIVVNTYPKGAQVGKIYSWVQGKDGQIWWDVDYFSGVHAGFIPNDQKFFDQDVLNSTSSGKAFDDSKASIAAQDAKPNAIQALGNAAGDLTTGISKGISGIGDAVGSLGSNIKWIILGVIILLIIFAFLKYGQK